MKSRRSDWGRPHRRQYTINDDFLDDIEEKQAWLIGLLAADGCVRSNKSGFSISQSGERGKALIETIQKMLAHTGNMFHAKTSAKISHTISITSYKLVERLKAFNIVPRKSLTYSFPERIPPKLHSAFLRGYIDGDGSTGIYKTTWGNDTLIISFVGTKKFIERCSQIVPVPPIPRKIKHARNTYELRWNGEKAIQFGRWVWNNPFLPRYYKQDSLDEFLLIGDTKYLRYVPIKELANDLIHGGMSVRETARCIGVSSRTISKWKQTKIISSI